MAPSLSFMLCAVLRMVLSFPLDVMFSNDKFCHRCVIDNAVCFFFRLPSAVALVGYKQFFNRKSYKNNHEQHMKGKHNRWLLFRICYAMNAIPLVFLPSPSGASVLPNRCIGCSDPVGPSSPLILVFPVSQCPIDPASLSPFLTHRSEVLVCLFRLVFLLMLHFPIWRMLHEVLGFTISTTFFFIVPLSR